MNKVKRGHALSRSASSKLWIYGFIIFIQVHVLFHELTPVDPLAGVAGPTSEVGVEFPARFPLGAGEAPDGKREGGPPLFGPNVRIKEMATSQNNTDSDSLYAFMPLYLYTTYHCLSYDDTKPSVFTLHLPLSALSRDPPFCGPSVHLFS